MSLGLQDVRISEMFNEKDIGSVRDTQGRPASFADLVQILESLGAVREWKCQHGRGGEKLCREIWAYDPTLHKNCGPYLVLRLEAPNGRR